MTSIYIETYGCSLNFSDSERMAGLLKQAKFEIIENEEEADIIIINTCTVKSPTESAFFTRLGELKQKYPYKIIIIAGCIAQTESQKLKGYPLIGTKEIQNVVSTVEEILHDNVTASVSTENNPPLILPKIRKNPIIEIIPISRGCLGYCSFCKTKSARGNLISYPIKEIKQQLEIALTQGVKEVWLTSQDCGCYGFDLNTDLAELLDELVKVPEDFKIRVGMMNPDHLLKIKDKLIKSYQNPKIFKFLHLPVQSGNDDILKAMNRKYTAEDFMQLVHELRMKVEDITIATDIIVGFPGETERQYWDTLFLVRKMIPDVVNISRYWARPKTPAAKMKNQLPGEEIKRRSRVLAEIFNNISLLNHEKWKNWEGEILIDDQGKNNTLVGRNFAYKPVVLEENNNLKKGDIVKVKIKGYTTWDLRGEVN